MSAEYIPKAGDRIKVVGFRNEDAYSHTPDKWIGKQFTVKDDISIRSFYPGSWGFATNDRFVVFHAVIIEQVV